MLDSVFYSFPNKCCPNSCERQLFFERCRQSRYLELKIEVLSHQLESAFFWLLGTFQRSQCYLMAPGVFCILHIF